VHDPSLARSLTAIVHQVEPDLAIRVRSMDEATAFALIPLRVAVAVLGFAGFAGLALAVLGVAGVVAFVVARRNREIGIRMALGANRHRVERLIVLQGLTPVVVGLVIGAAAALAAGRLIRGLLVDVSPTDPVTWLAVPLLLLLTAAAAAALPARRAARVDPLVVLREE
jgi:ABC-type antimicrobial peptide transport system permease subunit